MATTLFSYWLSQFDYNRGCLHMKSRVVKRSIVVNGHKTSVSLEDEFWSALNTGSPNP
jgi:Ribbon-helix-helix domain